MVRQVLVVAILMIVHGVMVAGLGLLFVVGSAGAPTFLDAAMQGNKEIGPEDKAKIIEVASAVYLSLGVVALVVGVLHIAGGICCLRFRARALPLIALFANILSSFTCYCTPTSLAMAIYGMIVLFNGEVAKAFAMGAQGATPDEIKRAFDKNRADASRDVYDDQRPRG
jgi:hypothetical protein